MKQSDKVAQAKREHLYEHIKDELQTWDVCSMLRNINSIMYRQALPADSLEAREGLKQATTDELFTLKLVADMICSMDHIIKQ